MHLGEAASRFASAEVFEARYPLRWERVELAPDSGGAGRHAGGLGVDAAVTALADAWVTCVAERTRPRRGGSPAEATPARTPWCCTASTAPSAPCAKGTGLPRGRHLRSRHRRRRGFGRPAERDPAAVRATCATG